MKRLAKLWRAIKDSAVYAHPVPPTEAYAWEMLQRDDWDLYC